MPAQVWRSICDHPNADISWNAFEKRHFRYKGRGIAINCLAFVPLRGSNCLEVHAVSALIN